MSKHASEPFVYEKASEKLIEFVPELEDAYRRELDWWKTETPGPHVLYDEILNPYINELLGCPAETDQRLKRVFDFIELLSAAADPRLSDLVAVTILEPLIGDPVRLDRAKEYMGSSTLGVLKKVRRR